MTRQQAWAKAAFESVRKVADAKADRTEKKYATHCMKAPTLLRHAGLVQAIAFLRTRGDEGKRYVDDLAHALGTTTDKLQKDAHSAALPDYMRLSRDAAGAAAWFRRFAQGELKQDLVQSASED